VACTITAEPLDSAALIDSVRGPDCGAIVTFLGVVRADSDATGQVEALAYEAYDALALREMQAICLEAAARFGGARVAIAHRTGYCRVGEASVAIAVAAEHRAAAFDACEYAIDELKRRVAVWKQERYRGGAARWRQNVIP
jgi:molybdopterin synthase catalytic subunit